MFLNNVYYVVLCLSQLCMYEISDLSKTLSNATKIPIILSYPVAVFLSLIGVSHVLSPVGRLHWIGMSELSYFSIFICITFNATFFFLFIFFVYYALSVYVSSGYS
jgi:hypothetical protein